MLFNIKYLISASTGPFWFKPSVLWNSYARQLFETKVVKEQVMKQENMLSLLKVRNCQYIMHLIPRLINYK